VRIWNILGSFIDLLDDNNLLACLTALEDNGYLRIHRYNDDELPTLRTLYLAGLVY